MNSSSSSFLREGPPPNIWSVFANLTHFPTCRKILWGSAQWFPLAKAGKEAPYNIQGGRAHTKVLFLAVCWLKFMKFRFPIVYSMFLSEDIRHQVSKSSNNDQLYRVFDLQFLGRDNYIYGSMLARLAKFGWIALAEFRVRSLAMKKMQNLRRVGKNFGPMFRGLCTKVHEILGLCTDSILSNCLYLVSFRRCSPLNLPLSCEVVIKRRK